MKNKLPTIRIFTSTRNPNWKHGDPIDSWRIDEEHKAEILSISFNTRKMRVRYEDAFRKHVITMPADGFLRDLQDWC